MPTVKVNGLYKSYRVKEKQPGLWGSVKSLFHSRHKIVPAVNGISFKIEPGELIGFIGPNGAGKTTTLKCLSGLLYPDRGEISVLGHQPWRRHTSFLRQIAFVMGQKNQLWWELPPMETFLLNRAVYNIPRRKFRRRLDELVSLLEVEKIIRTQTRKLSLGQRMKCELIAALLHQPQVLFLDEPTIGLDVIMQKKIRDFIKVYNEKYRATIILTSHYMRDVQQLAKRVIIINYGKIIFNGPLATIAERYQRQKQISLVLDKNVSQKEIAKFGKIKTWQYPRAVITVARSEISTIVSQMLQELPIRDINVEDLAIDEIIRRFFVKNKAEQ